jgi:hypothetical protein
MSERLARKLRIKAFGSMLRKRIAWFDKCVADAVFIFRYWTTALLPLCVTNGACLMWLCVSQGGELDRLAHYPALRGRLEGTAPSLQCLPTTATCYRIGHTFSSLNPSFLPFSLPPSECVPFCVCVPPR